MQRAALVFLLAGTLVAASPAGHPPARPRLLGLSQIVVRAHDLNASRHFYHDLLGFDEAFTVLKDGSAVVKSGVPADQASAVFFKVNNRQYIVVMPEKSASEPRFVRYAVETDNAERMRLFLKARGFHAPETVTRTPLGDLAFDVADPDGTSIQVVEYTPESLSVKTVGKFLSDNRLSSRMLHAGFSISKPETVRFYLDGFSVREFWRADPTMHAPGAKPSSAPPSGPVLASLSNLKMPEGDDYIEWSISRKPLAAPGSGGHIALETPDMRRTLAAIEARPAFRDYNRRHEAHVGVNHKWQGNFFDPDGTRTEFMEPGTADGMPSPMSYAPYF
ncbi:MAG TPA: VOC family protein [Bryobacteraceae bacterium]|jgi:lactoylglutathione lyase|nr:VOC family protein [Bryobacteraceae bacterium]